MRVVFMGTPEFARPSLQHLHDSSHEVVAVVTGHDKPVGRGGRSRGRILFQPAIEQLAVDLGYPVLQPERLKDETFQSQLADLSIDLLVVVAFRILPRSVLAVPVRGAVNLHPSLLPRYRGAAPIQHCLLAGDTVTGVSTTTMTMDIDAGGILLQRQHPIRSDDDFGTLSQQLAQLGAELLTETLDKMESGELTPLPQVAVSPGDQPRAPKITPDDLLIRWERPAQAIVNQIRAFSPKPGAATFWNGQRLKLFGAKAADGEGEPGVVQGVSQGRLVIGTADGRLEAAEVQLEGRRRMSIEAFLRGADLQPGMALG